MSEKPKEADLELIGKCEDQVRVMGVIRVVYCIRLHESLQSLGIDVGLIRDLYIACNDRQAGRMGDDGRGPLGEPLVLVISQGDRIVPEGIHDPHLGLALQQVERGSHHEIAGIDKQDRDTQRFSVFPNLVHHGRHPRHTPQRTLARSRWRIIRFRKSQEMRVHVIRVQDRQLLSPDKRYS